MTRHINAIGLEKIKSFEGVRLKAYQDSVGVWTIGYGHTKNVRPGQVITQGEADQLLRDDLLDAERAVSSLVKVNLTDNQFAALVSFVFNLGAGTLQKSTLLRKLNAGDYDAVPREMLKFVNAGGKPLKGLVNRRAAEAGLWAKGDFVTSRDVQAAPAKPSVVNKTNSGATITAAGVAIDAASKSLDGLKESIPVLNYVVAALIVVGLVLVVWGIVKGREE